MRTHWNEEQLLKKQAFRAPQTEKQTTTKFFSSYSMKVTFKKKSVEKKKIDN